MAFGSFENASSHLLLSSSSSSSSSPCKYDVFLSFRGQDTGKSFVDNLYHVLNVNGVVTFRYDNEELEGGRGRSWQRLLETIEKSRFSIVIFSRNYASSKWCCKELVKVVERMKISGQIVIPIFYDVDPIEVQNLQIGEFGNAFAQHEETYKENLELVQTWRAAMSEVGHLSGWDLQNRHDDEEAIIKELVKQIKRAKHGGRQGDKPTNIASQSSQTNKQDALLLAIS